MGQRAFQSWLQGHLFSTTKAFALSLINFNEKFVRWDWDLILFCRRCSERVKSHIELYFDRSWPQVKNRRGNFTGRFNRWKFEVAKESGSSNGFLWGTCGLICGNHRGQKNYRYLPTNFDSIEFLDLSRWDNFIDKLIMGHGNNLLGLRWLNAFWVRAINKKSALSHTLDLA